MSLPLSPTLWFESLRTIGSRVVHRDLPLEAGIRHAYHLRQLAPGAIRQLFPTEISEKAFRKTMKKGDLSQALDFLVSADLFAFEEAKSEDGYLVRARTKVFDATGKGQGMEIVEARFTAWLACISKIENRLAQTVTA